MGHTSHRKPEPHLPLLSFREAMPAQSKPDQPSYLKDHRKRLRERFLIGGSGPMPDYELLELLLFRAIPRRDVKPIARNLLETFGDFNSVITAPLSRLKNISGLGSSAIVELKIVEAAAQRLSRARMLNKPVISGWNALLDYCHTVMAHRETEEFRVLYLNTKNMILADECAGVGTVNHVPVYPREIVRRCLDLSASAIILVHNHPTGDPTPSPADIEMTAKIEKAAQVFDIALHDHVIIGKETELSFRGSGLL
jgi:DNA repair protein RadC